MTDRPTDDAEYGLVMPFVTVTSKGGPHDDDSYVCGYECGEWSAKLERRTIAATTSMVHAANVPQLDLIAMRHGYRLDVLDDVVGDEHEGWTHVGFTRDDTGDDR